MMFLCGLQSSVPGAPIVCHVPAYMADDVVSISGRSLLQSASDRHCPHTHSSFSDISLSIADPCVRNGLPSSLGQDVSYKQSTWLLKTFLFGSLFAMVHYVRFVVCALEIFLLTVLMYTVHF